MKKTLFAAAALVGLSLPSLAVDYVPWVDWDRIAHWAGDPDGEKKCALIIDFQDDQSQECLVWGYRWNGTKTGEDLVRAVASQSSVLTAMIQYTGNMGSTLNGLGISIGSREVLDYLDYDFDRAAYAGEVSFGYFYPNATMGQLTAPGDEAYNMCIEAKERAKETGIIEHPLNAFVYGYPAYDYDYWKLEEGYYSYEYRWRSGWYDGYWSYWCGPNDYDYMSYSGLGMSSVVLEDGCVEAWKWTPINGGGSYGDTGGELYYDLDYDILLYEEQMHEVEEPVQPVDQSKVDFWVGTGEKSATVVFQFNDGCGPENVVYGYRWSGGWDDNLSTVLANIAKADPRMTLSTVDGRRTVTYDSDCDGVLGTNDHTDVENTWNCYVKRVVDEDFNKVSTDRWLNPNAVLIFSHQEADKDEVSLPYLLYRPALDSEQIVTIPDHIDYALADDNMQIPLFVQFPEGGQLKASYSWEKPTVISTVSVSRLMGNVTAYKDFAPVTDGQVRVRCSYVAPGQTKTTYVYSNYTSVNLSAPVRPVTAMHFESAAVDARLNRVVDNALVFEPADATYTKVALATGDRTVATVSGTTVKTSAKSGTATITATYDYDKSLTAAYTINSALGEAVTDVTFDCVDDEGYITLTPKEMVGLFARIEPEDADIPTLTYTLSGNGTAKDNYIATMYKVNLWDADNVRTTPYELSGHRVGECLLTVKSEDGGGFVKTFPVRVVDREREPAIDYTTGTIMLNEEWFGHTNGGLNWYSPDYEVTYQAYERENPGMSFGATSQFGLIYGDRLIVSSKQAVDGGDPLPGGGRVVIADAATLRRIGSIDNLMWGDETKSADGRGICGAGPGRVYVGSSSGIYIVDIEACEVVGKIQGSDPDGVASDLYSGQIGDMVLAGRYAYALRQSTGVYMIDTDTDEIVKAIDDANVQGITQSGDGDVWYATIVDGHSVFVALDRETGGERTRIDVPAECGNVTCGWGAWRTTQFTSSHARNTLFFAGGASISNGGSGVIWKYEIDTDEFVKLAAVSGLEAHTPGTTQGAYGTIRYDHRTNEIIAGTTEYKASGHYRYNWTHFIDADNGGIVRTIELRPYYWFQSMPIFPDVHSAMLEDMDVVEMGVDDEPVELTLNAIDLDGYDSNIRYSLMTDAAVTADAADVPVVATLDGNKLTVTPASEGTHTIYVGLESNGRITRHAIEVNVKSGTTTGVDVVGSASGKVSVVDRHVVVAGFEGVTFDIVTLQGISLGTFTATSSRYVCDLELTPGVYVVTGDNGQTIKVMVK